MYVDETKAIIVTSNKKIFLSIVARAPFKIVAARGAFKIVAARGAFMIVAASIEATS